jgi:peptidoglycan/xylan/chitin deacetylase (PgdA/CDA1 family)
MPQKLGWLFLTVIAAAGPLPAARLAVRPYRALLIIERWSDPTSVLVDHDKDYFQPVAALLKAWSVPFDVLRLDQQHLDGTYLFSRSGDVRYGVVIWLADAPAYSNQDVGSLEQAVHAGTSLLVAKSRFLDSALERLLGLKFKEAYTATDPLRVTEVHFITRELTAQKMDRFDVSWDFDNRIWVEPQAATVLIDQNRHPVLTINRPEQESSAIWVGVPTLSLFRDSVYWRQLFFRSLLYSLGYLVSANIDYTHRIEMEIDDWGTADKGFLSYWRYLEPAEDTLRQYLIAPLEKRHAVVAANVITGYVDQNQKSIASPWTQRFTDRYGLQQDYASTQRGLKAAVSAGVVEIESHGWTHMQPDLESPPGPWWTADLEGEGSADGWYTEFEDLRRGVESPAIVQLFRMKRSLDYLQEDFGHRALELRPGGGGWSKSQFNNTGRIAARAGFGLFHAEPDSYYYLDKDLVLDMAGIAPQIATTSYDRLGELHPERWPAHPDGPAMLLFHDRDIALQHEFVERLFAALPPTYETLSVNEYIGILHAQIDSSANGGWQITFGFDPSYCAYFENHSSSWRLWLSDAFAERLTALQGLQISVDRRAPLKIKAAEFLGGTMTIDLPAGLGTHVWKLEEAR